MRGAVYMQRAPAVAAGLWFLDALSLLPGGGGVVTGYANERGLISALAAAATERERERQ